MKDLTFKKIEIEAKILMLLESQEEIRTLDVIKATKLKDNTSNRRTIQRAFESLIKEKSLSIRGNARARSYFLSNKKSISDSAKTRT